MIVAEMLLPKLNEWAPAGEGRHSLSHALTDCGWSLHLTADRVDTLGCLVWELILNRTRSETITVTELKSRALKTAARATGLIEPLRLVEIDESRGEALIRSDSPTRRSESLAYYEVLMNVEQQIYVRRYRFGLEKSKREQVAFALTHEAIAKLVDDLIRD